MENKENKTNQDEISGLLQRTKQGIRDAMSEFIIESRSFSEELFEGYEKEARDIGFIYAIEAIMDRMDDLNNE